MTGAFRHLDGLKYLRFFPLLVCVVLAVVACGKAALPMAAEAARHYGDRCEGIVIFPGDPGTAPRLHAAGLRPYPSSHPVPDTNSVHAARAALDLASRLADTDLLLVLP